jgi:hypothetical protein
LASDHSSPSDEDPRTELATIVVHQLRNRLARIVFGVEALTKAGAAHPELGPITARLQRGTDELLAWLDQFVEFARVLSGRVHLRKEPVALAALVGAVVEKAKPIFDARQLELWLELPADPLFVDGDRTSLELVVSNLLGNAAKFTPPHGRIQLSAACEPRAIILKVKDTGCGISPDALAHIFDGRPGRSAAKPSALGGGLLVVRSLVELHGGRVEASSQGPGRGSEFVIFLPRGDAPVLSAESESGNRVLVLHSDGSAAQMLAVLLRSWGYHARVVKEPATTLDEAQAFVPDLIVADAMGSGASALWAQLRGHPRLGRVRLVAVGSERPAGFDGHVEPPLDPDVLHALLLQLEQEGSD